MATYTTGTVSITNGSTNLNGSGTNWTSGAININWFITFDNQETWYEIKSIDSNINITLATQYNGPSLANATYYAIDEIPTLSMTIIYNNLFGNLSPIEPTTPGIVWDDGGSLAITH